MTSQNGFAASCNTQAQDWGVMSQSVKEWKYDYYTDLENGVRTYKHFAVNARTGERIALGFSDRHMVSEQAFFQLATMGFPERSGSEGWTEATVSFAYWSFQDREAQCSDYYTSAPLLLLYLAIGTVLAVGLYLIIVQLISHV